MTDIDGVEVPPAKAALMRRKVELALKAADRADNLIGDAWAYAATVLGHPHAATGYLASADCDSTEIVDNLRTALRVLRGEQEE